jgi:ATP-dependent Clp protease ATP-binding subunit ClpC
MSKLDLLGLLVRGRGGLGVLGVCLSASPSMLDRSWCGPRKRPGLRHNYIGTEHILLGLISGGDGGAVRVLDALGADAERIRNEVIRMLSTPEARAYVARMEVTSVSSEASIHVDPSAIVRRLLMSGAARALDDSRSEIEVADLLLALTRDEATSRLLASLGVDVTAVRNALEQSPPAPTCD